MPTRNLLLTALAATASLCVLVGPAGAAEAPAAPKVILAMERSAEAASFRAQIESYVREVNERALTKLNEDLRRELGQKVVIGRDELRTRG
ncbi:MAG TPA: hypothetical protein VKA43_10415 [Gammaproteobacteria bacterium]|nr:hypothetical protein [Gammaproteobacteria bacterium]